MAEVGMAEVGMDVPQHIARPAAILQHGGQQRDVQLRDQPLPRLVGKECLRDEPRAAQ
jgi:hypothetical protein